MAKLPRGKTKHPPSHSKAMKAKWLDPEYRAKMAERDRKRVAAAKADPQRFSRAGIPNGMRRDEAERRWALADKQADNVIKALKDAGELPVTAAADPQAIPDTDEGMAEIVLREAFKMALGPTGTRTKTSAISMVLKYTRLQPIQILQLAGGGNRIQRTAESVLDELAACPN